MGFYAINAEQSGMRNHFSDLSASRSWGSMRTQVATVRKRIHWDLGPFYPLPKPLQWINSGLAFPHLVIFSGLLQDIVISSHMSGWVSHPSPSLEPTLSRIKSIVPWGYFKPGTISFEQPVPIPNLFWWFSFADFACLVLLTLWRIYYFCTPWARRRDELSHKLSSLHFFHLARM